MAKRSQSKEAKRAGATRNTAATSSMVRERVPTPAASTPAAEAVGRPSGLHRRGSIGPPSVRPSSVPPGTVLQTPSLATVVDVVLSLSRAVRLEMHDEEIVHAYMQELRKLLPARHLAIRLFAADTGRLTLVYATGRLIPERRDEILVTKEALERHGIDAHANGRAMQHAEKYVPLFAEGAVGFDVPMSDGELMVGVLAVEYPHGVAAPPDDRSVVVPLAVQLGSALRHARLLREAVYLRDYLSKLLDHANAPIIVIGRRREVTVVNLAVLALTGLDRESALGRDFITLVSEEERRRIMPVFIDALRGVPTSNFEVKLPRAGGGFARIAFNVASILSADGEVDGVIAIGRDLTEVRELESQVIQAEKLATLGQLAAGVVHEINNPLTSISVYSDYLLKKGERAHADPADVEKLRRIVHASERILNFTRDLVAYARPSAEQPRSVSIHDVLDQSVMFCEHVIRESGVVVEKRYALELPPVFAVKGQLHQVFINLITNACQAMPAGKGRLVLETRMADSGRLLVRMTDNGSGIAPEHAERIFEPFFSTKSEGRGTGLGLSIVRNIIEQHRGEVRVRSAVGEGTSFEITLLCRADAG